MADESAQLNILQVKARQWASKVVDLYNTPVPQQFQAEKNALLAFALKIKNAVEKLTGPIGALSEMNSIAASQLGFIPYIVGGVAVTAAIAAIVKWTYDYNKFKSKLTEIKSLQDGGLSAGDAYNLVNSVDTPAFLAGVNKTVLTIGGVGALYLVAKKLRWI